MNLIDRSARKQLLLTRIAHERLALRRDVAQLREAAQPQSLLRHALGGRFSRALSTAQEAGAAGWISAALTWLRRYRFAAALLGSVAPLLRSRSGPRGRRAWRRLPMLVVLGGAAWLGWRLTRGRGGR